MGMVRYGKVNSRNTTWLKSDVLASGVPTKIVRVTGKFWDKESVPVISLPGFSTSDYVGVLEPMAVPTSGFPLDAILATGRAVYLVFTGSCWGHGTNTYPVLGGRGLASVDEAVELALSEHLTVSQIDLVGGSMGGLNAVTYGRIATTTVRKVILYVPAVVDVGFLWDIGGDIRTSMETVWGATGRTNVVSAMSSVNPSVVDCSDIASKSLVIAASNDPLLPYSEVVGWCNNYSVPIITTSTGHFSLDDVNLNEVTDILGFLS